jgi:hypothetical protein
LPKPALVWQGQGRIVCSLTLTKRHIARDAATSPLAEFT